MVPDYLMDYNHVSFRPSEIIFVDKVHGVLLKAENIMNVNTSISMGIDSNMSWQMEIDGHGMLKATRVSPIDISDDDITDIIANDGV